MIRAQRAWRSQTVRFASTRVANGAIALLSTGIPVGLAGAAAAGEYFALWTATWVSAVAGRFGSDAVLPRLVAENGPHANLELVRGRLRAGAACVFVLAVPACAALGADTSAITAGLVALTALLWARLFAIAGLMRARLRVALSGAMTNVVWSLASLIGPCAAALLVDDASAEAMMAGTLAASAVALAVAARVASGALRLGGPERDAAHAADGADRDGEVVGGAVLSTLVEVATWSPMIYASLIGLDAAATAAVFAATRLAGVASWAYQALVATAGPQIARAIVRRDPVAVRSIVWRAGRTGALVTAPVILVGVLAADEATAILVGVDAAGGAAEALRILLVARFIDAATGPIGEAFVVGRRIWLDAALIALGLLGALVAASLVPSDAVGAAVLAASASTMTNVVRALLFRWQLAASLTRPAPA